MSITVTATTEVSAAVYQVAVTLSSYDLIADPVAYVSTASVYAEILSRAGLDADLNFLGASLSTTGMLGSLRTYDLTVQFSSGDSLASGIGHEHTYTTLTFPLRESYRDGATIDLDSTLGPVKLTYSDDTTVDYFRVQTDTATTTRDLFYLKQGSIAQFGAHQTFVNDATYDIGTPDAGVTEQRPRDVRLSRSLYAGSNGTFGGYGSFGSYVLSAYDRFTAQATNPDTDSSHRHVYVNSVDNSLRYWDGSTENVLISPSTSDTIGTYTCPGGTAVGDVVYSNGDGTCASAVASVLGGKPPLGIVASKPTSTSAVVKYVGEVNLSGPLVPGSAYYVDPSTAGAITAVPSGLSEGDTRALVGIAKTTTVLVVIVGPAEKL